MLRFLCCCFFTEDSENERQPLLESKSSDANEAGSARQTLPSHKAQSVSRTGRLLMRRVCVPDLDKRFSDMAETFNEQQECYEAMVGHIDNLRHTYGCAHRDTLSFSECLGKIRNEHNASYRISLKMRGYDFYLSVVPVGLEDESEAKMLPPCLRTAQSELRGTCERAKATISKGTTLQELIGWLLRSRDQMSNRVNEATPSYQERGRLNENLEENMKEVRRAKDLSMKYRQQAGEVFVEAAQIAGNYL
ncbi:uncharacterized protein si:ch73-345f18.3 [Betta splendens]|uniref:Uncharacterized protein si:ch73-345f18.3 n=1 Tax=Betta splendens TaxID=158456 RepID=A0A6P7NTA5_BETSP|nr:uncharacterized protein si:ch73-345f18.3 [Betta splendens]